MATACMLYDMVIHYINMRLASKPVHKVKLCQVTRVTGKVTLMGSRHQVTESYAGHGESYDIEW